MKLLIDFGNSRFKWALLNGESLGELYFGNYEYNSPIDSIGALLQVMPLNQVEEIHAVSVLGETFNSEFVQSVSNTSNITVNFYFSQKENYGVQLSYSDPSEYGVDRYAALVAAHHLFDRNKIIIDCGTAVTVDAIDSTGKHLGGIILPGEEIMREALSENTEQVFYGDQSKISNYLNSSTSDAVNAGAVLGLKHSVWGILTEIRKTLEEPNIIITGGNAAKLYDSSIEPYINHPTLVLEGLKTMINFNNQAKSDR